MPSDRVKGENTELFASVPVPKAILSLAVPTVISQLVFVIYNIADTFFIGQLGDPDQVAAATAQQKQLRKKRRQSSTLSLQK